MAYHSRYVRSLSWQKHQLVEYNLNKNSPEVRSLVTVNAETFAYYDPDSPNSILKALDDLDKYIEIEGPFDGVLGFSQGAVLAATFGIRKYQQDQANQRINPIVKCNIFISAALPISWQGLLRGEIRPFIIEQGRDPIHVPTAMIWGQEDLYLRNVNSLLLELCQSPNVVGYMHNGGHEVPNSTSMEALAETVKMIKRTIDMAGK